MTKDPRRDDTNPPPRPKMQGVELGAPLRVKVEEKQPEPTPEPPPQSVKVERGQWSQFLTLASFVVKHGSTRTPIGISIALAAFFGAIIWVAVHAIGGNDGAVKIAHALGKGLGNSDEILMHIKALREDIKIERAERQRMQAEITCSREVNAKLCHFVSEINGGRPNKNWCGAPGEGLTWTHSRDGNPPLLRTDAAWPDCQAVAANVTIPTKD